MEDERAWGLRVGVGVVRECKGQLGGQGPMSGVRDPILGDWNLNP